MIDMENADFAAKLLSNFLPYKKGAFEAFERGLKDGAEQPHDLTSGMTYDDASLNEIYDEGVNIGQALARLQKLE